LVAVNLLVVLLAGPASLTDQARMVMAKTKQDLDGVTVWPIGFSKNGIVAFVSKTSDEMCEDTGGERVVLSVFDLRNDKELERIDATLLVHGEPYPKAAHAEMIEKAGKRWFHTACDRLTRDPHTAFAENLQKLVAQYGLTLRGAGSLEVEHQTDDDNDETFSFVHKRHRYTLGTLGTLCKDKDLKNLKAACQRIDEEENEDLEFSAEDTVADIVLWRGKAGKVIARWTDAGGGCVVSQLTRRIADVWLSPFEDRVAVIQVVGTCFEGDVSGETVSLIGAHLVSGFAKPTYVQQ